MRVTGLPGRRRHCEPEDPEKGRCASSLGGRVNAGGGAEGRGAGLCRGQGVHTGRVRSLSFSSVLTRLHSVTSSWGRAHSVSPSQLVLLGRATGGTGRAAGRQEEG